MNLIPKILQTEDLQTILALEKANQSFSSEADMDPMELEMLSWHAPWREESLKHYLPLGWSFGLWNEQNLQAYFLGQPQLFIRGLTQSLWIEHLSFTEKEHADQLIEIAYRLCREKHFQSLLIPNLSWSKNLPLGLTAEVWDSEYLAIKTAKF